jgi:hypothetical protein
MTNRNALIIEYGGIEGNKAGTTNIVCITFRLKNSFQHEVSESVIFKRHERSIVRLR